MYVLSYSIHFTLSKEMKCLRVSEIIQFDIKFSGPVPLLCTY